MSLKQTIPKMDRGVGLGADGWEDASSFLLMTFDDNDDEDVGDDDA